MLLEHIRLSQQAKEHLIKLKRVTGIENWNVLCRWGLCVSLAESASPSPTRIAVDSNIEMSWRVFSGSHSDLYLALVKVRCLQDGLGVDPETVAHQFRLHLHRGISYLAANKSLRKTIHLVSLAKAGKSEPITPPLTPLL